MYWEINFSIFTRAISTPSVFLLLACILNWIIFLLMVHSSSLSTLVVRNCKKIKKPLYWSKMFTSRTDFTSQTPPCIRLILPKTRVGPAIQGRTREEKVWRSIPDTSVDWQNCLHLANGENSGHRLGEFKKWRRLFLLFLLLMNLSIFLWHFFS